jgi:tripartite-type tricarboxylate transporter receptor subunit TctC
MRCKNLLVGAAILGTLTVGSIPVSAQDWPTEKMSPEAFTRFVETEIGRWGPIAKQVVKQ